MKVQKIPICELIEYEHNARRHGGRNMDTIKASLSRYGQVEPLVVQRSTRTVIGGNGRLVAMTELGWTDADVVMLDIDDDQVARLSVALNRSAELSTWDNDTLLSVLRELPENDLEELGFSVHELDALGDWTPGEIDPDSIEKHDEAKDTYLIKVEGVRPDDKDRLLRMVQDCLAAEQGLKINAY